MQPQSRLIGLPPTNQPSLTADNYRFTATDGTQYVLKDIVEKRFWDTYRFQAGQAVNQNPIRFFQIPQGQQQAGGNFTTQYAKGSIDTNMTTAGLIPKGQLLSIKSMQCRVQLTGATDSTYGSSGAATQLPTNPAGAATVSATNEIKAITEAATMVLNIDGRDFEDGKLVHFPSPYGYSGFAGGGIPGTANTDTVAIVNNGFGREFRFSFKREIDALRSFSVNLAFGYIFTPNRNFTIEIVLEGRLFRSVL